MSGCSSGNMPHADYTYEEFEELLGRYYLSLLPLKNSVRPEDRRDYQTAMCILNELAFRHGVQFPEEAVKNPRYFSYRHDQFGGSLFCLNTDFLFFGETITPTDEEDCQMALDVLWGIIKKYSENRVENVEPLSNLSMVTRISSIYDESGVRADPETTQDKDRLKQIILGVLGRHNIAEIVYRTNGEQTVLTLGSWNPSYKRKTLADVLAEEESFFLLEWNFPS
ncbi:hypothetical protein KY347_04975 [Candidatus Woesearchaeota archaeon]|nr:hypothetical protein [Candidatus Woesearchaeota archaeon]